MTTHDRFQVTRNGDRVAVLLGADDDDSLIETLDILSSLEEVAAVREGMDDLARGEVSSLEEMKSAMRATGRLAR